MDSKKYRIKKIDTCLLNKSDDKSFIQVDGYIDDKYNGLIDANTPSMIFKNKAPKVFENP